MGRLRWAMWSIAAAVALLGSFAQHGEAASPLGDPGSDAGPSASPAAAADVDVAPAGKPCAAPVQPLLDRAPQGATVMLPACVIRQTLVVPRAMTVRGVAGTEIRGSDIWDGWQADGTAWRSSRALPPMAAHGECRAGTMRCQWPEQAYRDGAALTQVEAAPGPGEFSVDAARHVVLGGDPSGHVLEVSVRSRWIVVRTDGVTIEGVVMRDATNDAQSGALADDGHAIVVRGCVLRDAHGADAWLTGRSELLDSDVGYAGQLGIGVGGERVAGNRVHHNNTEDFDPGWEAGGFKAVTNGVVVEDNEVDHNSGSGIWFDIGTRNAVVRDNRVHDNDRVGVFVEISSDVRVTGNTVWDNGAEDPGWVNGAGILVHTSVRVEVDHNLVAWNADGIGVESQDRPDRPAGAPMDIHVHDNVIAMEDGADTKLALGWVEDWAGPMFDPASHNDGEANRFWYQAGEGDTDRFAWSGPIARIAEFAGTAGGRDSTYLSDTDAIALLRDHGVPTAGPGGPGARARRDAGAEAQAAQLELVGLLLLALLAFSLVAVRLGALPGRLVAVVAPLVALGYVAVVVAIGRVDLVPDALEGVALVATVATELVALGVVGLRVWRAAATSRRGR